MNSTNGWNTRPATVADTDAILEFVALSLGQAIIPRSREFWEWKHVRNPFGPSRILLAESGSKIIGLRVFMNWVWRSGEIDVPATRAVDTATHPDWRGRHIFTELTIQLKQKMEKEGISFIYNTPNSSSLPGYLKMGWKRVSRIPLWIRPLRLIHPVRSLLFPTGRSQETRESDNFLSARDLLSQNDISAFLESSIQDETRFHTIRTLSYLKWRYAEIPNFPYGAKWRIASNTGAAVIFRKRRRKGLSEFSISELLHTPGDNGRNQCRQLIQELARETTADYMVAVASSNSPEEAILKKCGFIGLRLLGPIFTIRVLNKNTSLPDPENWSSWRCTIGDLEIF